MDEALRGIQNAHEFMLDKLIELVPGQRITAIKNVSMNEGFFEGHFPQMPVLPGALIIEAMAQAAKMLFSGKGELSLIHEYRISSIKAKFLNAVFPGDQLKIIVTQTGSSGLTGSFTGEAFVADKLAAKAEINLNKC